MVYDVFYYAKDGCPYCRDLKNYLNNNKNEFRYTGSTPIPEQVKELKQKNPGITFPVVIVNGGDVGGCSDFIKKHKTNTLCESLPFVE